MPPRLGALTRLLSLAVAALCLLGTAAQAADKPRVIILTDVLNEPDDSQSLIRALLYSNDVDIRGLVATTSTWQRTAVHPEEIRRLIAAYGEVLPNLRRHDKAFPEAATLLAAVRTGRAAYGM